MIIDIQLDMLIQIEAIEAYHVWLLEARIAKGRLMFSSVTGTRVNRMLKDSGTMTFQIEIS